MKEELNAVKSLLTILVQHHDTGFGVSVEKIKGNFTILWIIMFYTVFIKNFVFTEDYHERTESEIPYRRLGFENLNELLNHLPGIRTILLEGVPTLFVDNSISSINNQIINNYMH